MESPLPTPLSAILERKVAQAVIDTVPSSLREEADQAESAQGCPELSDLDELEAPPCGTEEAPAPGQEMKGERHAPTLDPRHV